jgi:hypothetical protein
MDEAIAAYERLKTDPDAWSEQLSEREAWEATLNDGLDDESGSAE